MTSSWRRKVQKVSLTSKITSGKTIIVDVNGSGKFTSVQDAIDSIPDGNQDWVVIHVKKGIYRLIDCKASRLERLEASWQSRGFIDQSALFIGELSCNAPRPGNSNGRFWPDKGTSKSGLNLGPERGTSNSDEGLL
ncbi:hypothetical protein L1987_61354 [Smallanthus sonchifolius]|uniref:Uncharacterized protein n=1 Tax=Smallanthus sonchifolius TaxID=185202 RepID=A0ACB9DB80_9ASTR|nr:hypothetical protein L1987_61354 [Smallanthus sonchifolius]